MKKYVSLTFKITAFSTAIVLVVSIIIAVIVYTASNKLFLNMSVKHIKNEAHLISNDVENALIKVANDLIIISKTPPIQGIVRSAENNGTDQLEKSDLPMWRNRLETIFESTLEVNKNYTQIRYIGITENGKELVRVDQSNQDIYRVHKSALQEKGGREYFKLGTRLTQGSVDFSKIDYNKEDGKLQRPIIVTLRAITPIYSDKQKLFGMLVINVNVLSYFREVLIQSDIKHDVILFDPQKNFFIFDHNEKTLRFIEHDEVIEEGVFGNKSITSPKDIIPFLEKEKDRITILRKIYIDHHRSQNLLTAMVSIPKSSIKSDDSFFIRYVMFCVISVCLLSALLIFIFSHKSMKPLSEMVDAIKKSTAFSPEKTKLPVHLNDEVGLLARAFEEKTKMLNQLALYDSLTGLPNRKSLIDHIEGSIQQAKKHNTYFGIIFVDINGFKEVNDSYGHDYGDELLIKLSKKIKETLQKDDYCARLGGDEFAILIKDTSTLEETLKAYSTALNTTYQIKGINLNIISSGGAAIYPDDGLNTSELLKKADEAMYQSKRKGDGSFIRYKKT